MGWSNAPTAPSPPTTTGSTSPPAWAASGPSPSTASTTPPPSPSTPPSSSAPMPWPAPRFRCCAPCPPVSAGRFSGGTRTPARVSVGPDHPAQQLLDRVNPWHTRGDLWRATEINLCLWGSSFWALERDEAGRPEIWPLRSDRVRVLPEKQRHVKGFVYMGVNGPVAYTPEEIVWMRYYNPLEPFAGLSPLAPVRLSVDAGLDALRFNRSFFKNSAQPDIVFTTEETMTDAEVEDFYHRWEERYQGPGKAHRPAIASFIKDIKTLGFNHREMEFLQGLRWSLEGRQPHLRRPPAPALRLPAGHLRQHHHSGEALLAQHHRPRNALPRRAPQQRTPPPPRLRRPHRRVRPLHHRSNGRRRNRTRRPRNQTPRPWRPNHQRSPRKPATSPKSPGATPPTPQRDAHGRRMEGVRNSEIAGGVELR